MPTRQPDSHCISRAASGDSAALADLFEAYGRDVHRVALLLTGSPDDADDVVQDVFIGLPEALRRYRERGSFETWLKSIAVRVALMRLRAGRVRSAYSAEQSTLVVPINAEDEQVTRLSVEVALNSLAAEYREVFVLKIIEGFSHDEIAEIVGVLRGTSEVRLFRAIRQLRAILGRN
jgi:RNA polymerase sigma-70 factor (ECF subfamily)